jgi:hypothetical protein
MEKPVVQLRIEAPQGAGKTVVAKRIAKHLSEDHAYRLTRPASSYDSEDSYHLEDEYHIVQMRTKQTKKKEISLQNLMNWNHQFAKRVFPKHCNDPVPPLHHLKKEVGETIDALEAKPNDREKVLFEYADCLILLVGSAIRAGISAEQLLDYSSRKMAINEKRDWGEPDENGVYLHKSGKEASNG